MCLWVQSEMHCVVSLSSLQNCGNDFIISDAFSYIDQQPVTRFIEPQNAMTDQSTLKYVRELYNKMLCPHKAA